MMRDTLLVMTFLPESARICRGDYQHGDYDEDAAHNCSVQPLIETFRVLAFTQCRIPNRFERKACSHDDCKGDNAASDHESHQRPD